MPFPSDILQVILDYIYTDEAVIVKGKDIDRMGINYMFGDLGTVGGGGRGDENSISSKMPA